MARTKYLVVEMVRISNPLSKDTEKSFPEKNRFIRSLPSQERIKFPFVPDGSGAPVPGMHREGIRERPQLFADAAEQGGMVAAREIGAADAFVEQYIAGNYKLLLRAHKADLAGSMARCKNDVEPVTVKFDPIAFVQAELWFGLRIGPDVP